jgi:hypothetical protein
MADIIKLAVQPTFNIILDSCSALGQTQSGTKKKVRRVCVSRQCISNRLFENVNLGRLNGSKSGIFTFFHALLSPNIERRWMR